MKNIISIAVVIPCYNSAATILSCLNSVFSQSSNVDEIIVVDDGSTDGSDKIVIDRFDSDNSSIIKKIIYQKNSGPSRARNCGVMVTSSTHIAFLDSDDFWFEDKIKFQKEFLEQSAEYKIIGTKYISANLDYDGPISFNRELYKNFFLTPCVIIEKACFIQCGGFNEDMKYAEDYYLWLKVLFDFKGYLLDYVGAANLEEKRIFGEKGLSSNLREMHLGVVLCLKMLYMERKISIAKYYLLQCWEYVKFSRRHLISLQS
ncbi:glycosyltransferase family 2 protein [Pedobacter sp. MR2016-24]|uniref:glycosyltransferase family 2 protein n=1 Tax=Pedobacter sp. MR2016-24 TaxID=2994466 RepID=UPI0022453D7B|nr:glycosyltransferase family A protein [Pedobacter sp. MR2016-24]MCX2485261.1 glycosyltransferase family A protein [Pedobacter sp. MR2016-24]